MEFLDPKKKRQHLIQLYIGYGLMAIVVVLATMVFVYQAKGFDLDRKSGEIIQNGLVFVDSNPQGASITLNGEKLRESTDARLVIKEGQYTVKVEKPGYHSWEKTFVLGGGSIERFAYPFLFPDKPNEINGGVFAAQPLLTSTSPDRHWLFINEGITTAGFTVRVFDLSKENPSSESLIIPASDFASFNPAARLSVVEWSTDNRHLLLQYEVDGKRQFIVFDRANPDSVVNINSTFNLQPTRVALFDKAVEKAYLYDGATQELRVADLIKKTVNPPIAEKVLDFKTHGADTLLYTAILPTDTITAGVYVRHEEKTFLVRTLPYSETEKYLLDVARFDNNWYYVVATESEGKIYIYKDPKEMSASESAAYLSVMRLDSPQFVSFSANTRNIAVQSGSNIAVYDLETLRQYRYTLDGVVLTEDYKMEWMDGHRLLANKDGVAYVIDFDGTNQQKILSERVVGDTVYFDRNYKKMAAYRLIEGSTDMTLTFFDLLTPEK